jgi:hypothetical protein
MTNKIIQYREKLSGLTDWDAYLLQESGLPGPRANLELLEAVVEEGNNELFMRYLSSDDVTHAPVNSPEVFLTVCGVVGLGKMLCEGQLEVLNTLHDYASDSRWRIREGVVMALERWGHLNMPALLQVMKDWCQDSLLVKRAALAALCHPALLKRSEYAIEVLHLLDDATTSLLQIEDRKCEEFRVLKMALGYCWSVAVAALPEEGKPMLEKWATNTDRDIRWIVRENLGKKRLIQVDPVWVANLRAQ